MREKELSDDAQVIAMLCMALAKPNNVGASDCEPFSVREWHNLAVLLHQRGSRPRDLLLLSAQQLETILGLVSSEAERIARLLDRSAIFAFELERLRQQGIRILTRADGEYPSRLKNLLGGNAPPILFGAGSPQSLEQGGMAVVGSREIDDQDRLFAEQLGDTCAREGLTVISGGARGVDQISMEHAMLSGGKAFGVLSDNLSRHLRTSKIREQVSGGRLTLISPYNPDSHFSVAHAMGRNKLIYCLSDFATVVASSLKTGGTWAGATEALRARWVPIFIREAQRLSAGNRALLASGGIPLTEEHLIQEAHFKKWLMNHAEDFHAKNGVRRSVAGEQLSLML